ncbi:hypothetical protein [Algoriphagus namhaensis]
MSLEQVEHLRPALSEPSLEEVQNYFSAQDFPREEGEVFYFYYQGLGWRSETGSLLRDWKLAASRWLWNLEH